MLSQYHFLVFLCFHVSCLYSFAFYYFFQFVNGNLSLLNHVLNVLACSRALVFTCLRAHVFGVFAFLRAYVLPFLAFYHAWRTCVLTCLACSCARVLAVHGLLLCPHALRAYVLAMMKCFLTCLRAWRAQHWRTHVFVYLFILFA